MIRAQPQTNERARIWNAHALPALVSLITAHGHLRRVVPSPGGLAVHVVLTNQRSLNLAGAFTVNGLLPARLARLLARVMWNFVGFRRRMRGRFLRSLGGQRRR